MGEDSLELRLAEFPGLSQVLVIGDQPGDSLALGIGELEPQARSLGDPGACLLVMMEGVAAAVQHSGRGLAGVVQERGEGEREAGIGGQELEDQHRMVPEIALGLHRFALEQPLHCARAEAGSPRRGQSPRPGSWLARGSNEPASAAARGRFARRKRR